MPEGAATVEHKPAGTNWDAVIAGSTAGLISRFVVAPLDVVKIRLQLQTHSVRDAHAITGPTYKGIIGTIRTIVQQEGVTALWKGNVPAELMYVGYGAVQFFTLRNIHLLLDKAPLDIPEAAQSVIAGSLAGATATSATYPLDLMRTRFAVQGNERVYTSMAHAVRHIYAHEGGAGFFRGLSTAVLQIAPTSGIFFGVYETVRAVLRRRAYETRSGWENAAAGGVASMLAKTGVFPLDLLRKRLQVQGPTREMYVHKNIPLYAGLFGALRDIVRVEGWRGLYKGLTVSLVKAAPNSAATMWVFEWTMRFLATRREG